MGIFSKIHAYVLIKTRREFIHLRRLLMKRRRLLEILEIGCFVTMNFYFYLLIFYLFLHLYILLLGQNILRTFSMKKSVFINPFVDRKEDSRGVACCASCQRSVLRLLSAKRAAPPVGKAGNKG